MKKPSKKYKKRTLTVRQAKAKKNILENPRSQRKALKDAGYSQAYADHPAEFNATQAGQDLIAICNRIRDKSLKRAEETVNEAHYADAVRGAETLNKITRLETGESTENSKIELDFSGWNKPAVNK